MIFSLFWEGAFIRRGAFIRGGVYSRRAFIRGNTVNWKICQSSKLKEDSTIVLCGTAKKSSTQRNATILYGINLGHPRRSIFEKITSLAKNLKSHDCIFKILPDKKLLLMLSNVMNCLIDK